MGIVTKEMIFETLKKQNEWIQQEISVLTQPEETPDPLEAYYKEEMIQLLKKLWFYKDLMVNRTEWHSLSQDELQSRYNTLLLDDPINSPHLNWEWIQKH